MSFIFHVFIHSSNTYWDLLCARHFPHASPEWQGTTGIFFPLRDDDGGGDGGDDGGGGGGDGEDDHGDVMVMVMMMVMVKMTVVVW